MRKTYPAIVIFLSAALFVSLATAGTLPVVESSPPEVKSNQLPEDSESVVDRLSMNYQLWIEANLSGDKEAGQAYEKNMINVINYDMTVTEAGVRELARRATLSRNHSDESEATTLTRSGGTAAEEAFEQALARLNTKEALYRSINKTNAFSNKYRLLGDYVGLLRRELNMPRLKLAEVDNPENRSSLNRTPEMRH